jgi:hypothetical protein
MSFTRNENSRAQIPDVAPVFFVIIICIVMDTNYYSIADVTGVTLKDVTLDPRRDGIDPTIIDDVLKLSCATNILIENVVVDAGGLQQENAVDMNRLCRQITLKDCWLVSGMQNAITIKGGCSDVLIENVVIVPGQGHCDIELGNWADQSQDFVTNVTLRSVTRKDGKPVRLRVGHAKEPTIEGGNVKKDVLGSLMVKCYWQLKQWGIIK